MDGIALPIFSSGKGNEGLCTFCGLYKQATTPMMDPHGKGLKRILILGEAPGTEEDKGGHPWIGKAGQFLGHTLARLGVSIHEDTFSLNSVNCRPPDNRTPTSDEVGYCRRAKVLPAISRLKPKLILVMGPSALESLYGHRLGTLPSMTTMAGFVIPDSELGAWVAPLYHPSYVMGSKEQFPEVGVWWERDIARALDHLDRPLPDFDYRSRVKILPPGLGLEEEVLVSILREKPPLLAIDIEATGVKPFDRSKHSIISVALSWREDSSYAMAFPEEGSRARKILEKILVHQEIGKVAHNLKYEDHWLRVVGGMEVKPWVFDTVLASHILDNRQGLTSLKFLAFAYFGVTGYEDSVSPYMSTQGSNDVNSLRELFVRNPESLLLYNGLDALFTYMLAERFSKDIREEFSWLG